MSANVELNHPVKAVTQHAKHPEVIASHDHAATKRTSCAQLLNMMLLQYPSSVENLLFVLEFVVTIVCG